MTESGMLARVVFDEAHSEAWTVRPALARQMQPAHPGDSSYARAAAALAERDFVVEVNAEAPLSAETLGGAGVLVIAHPSDPTWERTTATGAPRLSPDEIDAVEAYEHYRNAPSWVLADLQRGGRGRAGDLLARVNAACLYRATTISSSNGAAVLARTHESASVPGAPLIIAATHGQGRVVVLA